MKPKTSRRKETIKMVADAKEIENRKMIKKKNQQNQKLLLQKDQQNRQTFI